VAAANLIHFAAMSYPPYLRAVGGGTFGSVTAIWFIVSARLLPVFVVFECWWMRNREQVRALLVDVVFTLVWLTAFGGSVIYGFCHFAIP
jgi:hypothetical protein